jgi:uncharacterized protein (TIGR03437 family)
MACRNFFLLTVLLSPLLAQEPGSGNVSVIIRDEFRRAYFRNNFHVNVSGPVGDVRRFGSTGLVQEFYDLSRTAGVRYALVRANTSDAVSAGVDGVLQVLPEMYSYYSSLGPNTVGYPTIDTVACPNSFTDGNSCRFQIFDKNHVLFAFAFNTSTLGGTNFAVKDPFFSRWRLLDGINRLGAAIGAEETVASGAGTDVAGILQRFQRGGMFNLTAGTLIGRMVVVQAPVWDLYQEQGGHRGFLGFPTGEPVNVGGDQRRQTFEGGAVDYSLAGNNATLRLPVATVVVAVGTPTQRLNLGESIRLDAATFAGNGAVLGGRQVTWLSSNSRILAVEPNGTSATVRAVGGGSANITAISEGKSSRIVTFFVIAPCCQVGEGAPTQAIQQSFLDAVVRGRLSLRLPGPSPVQRVGSGYTQEAVGNDGAAVLLAKADSTASTFFVAGTILARYLELGGPAGNLGYPSSDPTAAGRQVFEGGVLAGNPVNVVTAPILTRWASQGYESSPARLPAGSPVPVLTFAATLGLQQSFAGGSYFAHLSGAFSNRVFFVSGAVLNRYAASGGPSGVLGLPIGDEVALAGRRRQDFEGGTVSYAPGESDAQLEEKSRRPQISATPSTVAAGGRVRIAAGGFRQGATLRVTVGNQPDFTVATESGAYAWEAVVAANAESGLVNLRAADINGTAIAAGSYVIQSSAETLARITKLRGDLQTGYPGARLPIPLKIVVRDENGSPLAKVPVRFTPSPGAAIEEASAVTDPRGEAQAFLRLGLSEIPALATAEAGRQVVTFSARSAPGSFSNFPRFTQTGDVRLGNEQEPISKSGALLATAAAIVRHLQNTHQAGTLNGLADPQNLNAWLKELCAVDSKGERICDGFIAPPRGSSGNVNIWRLSSFAGGGFEPQPLEPSANNIRDALAAGFPVLLGLTISAGDVVVGSHFVAAIGVASGGQILIHDPSPVFNKTYMDEYFAGFSLSSVAVKGVISAAIRFVPQPQSNVGYLVLSDAGAPGVSAISGACGITASWPGQPFSGALPASEVPMQWLRYCDGALAAYQVELDGKSQALFLETGASPGRIVIDPAVAPAYRLTRAGGTWTIAPLEVTFGSDTVVNAASQLPELSPGALAHILGSGLARDGKVDVTVGGYPAAVSSSGSFRIAFRLPPELEAGPQPIRVSSAYGSAERTIQIDATSPALFTVDGLQAVATNQDGSPNGPLNPATRGQAVVVAGTGFGALRAQGNQQVLQVLPTATLNGRGIPIFYAGAVPGIPGLIQLNLQIPGDFPPGTGLPLVLVQDGRQTRSVTVSIQ